jgi:L-histidine Nalpha-methyltransferase
MGSNMSALTAAVNADHDSAVTCGTDIAVMVRHLPIVIRGALAQNNEVRSVANVTIHASQFPEQVRKDLLASFRTRRINHKFHYDSIKQTQRWLALHQAYSPSRTDPECFRIYEAGFAAAAGKVLQPKVHLIGLGCGGGQKDARLLQMLKSQGKNVAYTPSDVSTAMVLVAREAALTVVSDEDCFPLVCDLSTADDLDEVLDARLAPDVGRVITFFGMIPNFEPGMILPKLAKLIRREDLLLFSANLAPGADYRAGIQKILPLYDNELTRDWLMTVLLDVGIERGDGDLRFQIEADPAGGPLQRIAAHFDFAKTREIQIEAEKFRFQPGDKIQLFF